LQLWLFIVAPLIGAALAGLVYPFLAGEDAPSAPSKG
jgi:aquaporin Z